VVVGLPIAALRLAPEVFAPAHLLDMVAEAREPVDGAQHAGELADRNRAATEGVEHELQCRLRVLGLFDRRQLEGEQPVGAGRVQPLHAQAHGGGVAFLGELQNLLHRGLGPLVEQFLDREGLPVAGAERAAGRIAALTGGEAHGGKSFSVGL
jgi:hypothetical protein